MPLENVAFVMLIASFIHVSPIPSKKNKFQLLWHCGRSSNIYIPGSHAFCGFSLVLSTAALLYTCCEKSNPDCTLELRQYTANGTISVEKLYGFCLSIAYIARQHHPYIESLPTL